VATRGGLRAVEGAVDAARPAPRVGRKKETREDEQLEMPLLPAGCPIVPLGKSGQTCFYLDEQGQLISLGPRDHGKTHIQSLFGRRSGLVHEYWPRYGKPDPKTGEPVINGWMPEKAAETLQASCAHEGLFDPQGKVRGRGAWRSLDGDLILHHGDKIYRSGLAPGFGWTDPGKLDGYVYPTAPAMPRPDPAPVDVGAGVELLRLLRTWHWERPKIDPYLLLGFIAHAPFGGACDWRSMLWVTGDRATGKSTLEKKLLQWLFEGQSLRTHQATEAAIRQVLGNQTLPVFFDEIEADQNNDRAKKVIELARLASSEGVIFRGGSDHRATEFVARSCFYFSSILVPPMMPQDRSRMAILELKPIPDGAREPMIERQRVLELGAQLRRRVVDQWHRYEATLSAYRRALQGAGHSGRGADQFGTLLTFADLVLYDGPEPEPDVLSDWAQAMSAATLAEVADSASDAEEAIQFLSGYPLQLRGGDEPKPIARFIDAGLGRHTGGLDTQGDVQRARDTLENHGLKLVVAVQPKEEGKAWGSREPKGSELPTHLAIANSHEALDRIFRDKRWREGVWSQTFGRVPGALRRVQIRYARVGRKATLVPIDQILGDEVTS
jgi:hypothetical protein